MPRVIPKQVNQVAVIEDKFRRAWQLQPSLIADSTISAQFGAETQIGTRMHEVWWGLSMRLIFIQGSKVPPNCWARSPIISQLNSV
jgi:hypothetical protein